MQKLTMFVAAFLLAITSFGQEKKFPLKPGPFKFKPDTAAISNFYKRGEGYAAGKKKGILPKTKPVEIPLVAIAKTGIVPMPNAYNKQSDNSVVMPNAYVTVKASKESDK